MLSVLFSSALGFGSSFLPSLLKFAENRQKAKLEIQMMETKAKFAKELSSLKLKEAEQQALAQQAQSIYAHDETIQKANHSKFVASLSASVRPVITYIMFALFCLVVVSQVVVAIQEGEETLKAIRDSFSEEAYMILSSTVSFYFGGRMVRK
jgi:hypothetical protein|tara:strand:+ start:995 stop:1450 length:456 start_codon:yes stop_codon:yes gene_type:complete